MNVSKQAWHYKIAYQWLDFTPGKDLCTYCRRVFYAILCWIVITVIGANLAWSAIALPLGLILGWSVDGFMAKWMMMGLTIYITGFLFIAAVLAAYLRSQWQKNRLENVEKESGIVISYLKAKKGKYCPMITLED